MQYRFARRVALLSFSCVIACSSPVTPPGGDDTGVSDGGGSCGPCDDHVFCNGVEVCMAGRCSAGTSPCMPSQICDEAGDACTTVCATHPDADLDGSPSIACGGDDCDDSNPSVHPGATELCDALATNEDCDGTTFGTLDTDGDGHVNSGCCNGTTCGDDCDDTHADVYGGASETCNFRDDDCDEAIDETLATVSYYADCDGDGYGSTTGAPSCSAPMTPPSCFGGVWLTTTGDCNDMLAAAHPGVTDTCNGIDDDCNGTIDDAAAADLDCQTIHPAVAHTTIACMSGTCGLAPCDTGYANCDGSVDTGCETNTTSDHSHCGACDIVCGAAASCTASACTPLVDIDAGSGHTCALYANGRAVCWGLNNEGQLGDGTHVLRESAVPVSTFGGSPITFLEIDAGGYSSDVDSGATVLFGFTCGYDAGAAYCWGRNDEGQLGNGSVTDASVPMQVSVLPVSGPTDPGPPSFVQVSAGGAHTVIAQRRPRPGIPLWSTWGWGRDGVTALTSTPTQLTSGPEVDGVAAGLHHSCYRNGTDGGVYCWGSNAFGELGFVGGSTGAPTRSTAFPMGAWAAQVSAGGIIGLGFGVRGPSSAFTCARADDGRVYCWGSNDQGQLGTMVGGAVSGLTDAIDIAVGGRHACALRATGEIVCWGDNSARQLGDGSGLDSAVPVTVVGITTAIAITAGAEHSCAVLADGTARCWGDDSNGRLGDGPGGGIGIVTVLGT
jgi:alpha-tubulin suppressor-like RCC1 family protein